MVAVRSDIDSALGSDRPVKLGNGSMDILVLGSDSRSGANRGYGHDSGTARSDTAMIVHLAKGHRSASVVSIPRDTLISRPACAKRGGGTAPAARQAMFNSAYEVGGPVCAVKTVESHVSAVLRKLQLSTRHELTRWANERRLN